MAPPRKHLHVNFKIPPMGPTATRQLRNIPSRHIATPSQPIQQSTLGGSSHNNAPTSLAPDLDDSLDNDQPLAANRNQKTNQ